MNLSSNINSILENYNRDSAIVFKLLEENDFYKNYFDLLSQLTIAPTPSWENWLIRLNTLNSNKLTKIFVCQFEEKIIATITCSIELKFIRNLGSICHIEDFVIDEKFRKMGLGSKLLNIAKNFAKEMGCYKILLDSKDEVAGFYEKNGFKRSSCGMTIYFEI